MLYEKADQVLGIGESFLLSGIGILVVFLELILLAVMILIISKAINRLSQTTKEAEAAPAPVPAAPAAPPAPAAEAAPPQALPYTGTVRLENVTEPEAAVVMALVSHQTGIPLSRLAFRSIKGEGVRLEGVDEPTAAVVMALVSHQTGIPLDHLSFKSIKQV